MTAKRESAVAGSQSDKFKVLAHELECDEDEARWDEKLSKLVKVKPKPEKPAG